VRHQQDVLPQQVRRLGVLLLLAGCGGGHGKVYTLRVTPSAAAKLADGLSVRLSRTDVTDSVVTDLRLPAPTPTVPWTFDLDTHGWGAASFTLTAEAKSGSTVVARGTAGPQGDFVDVNLVDVAVVPDGGTPDLGAPDAGCQKVLTFSAEADTVIYPGLPGANYGADLVLQLTSGSTSLYRFNLTSLPLTATLISARMTLRDVPMSMACGSGCTACAAKETAGMMQAYFATSDWAETEATWVVRRTAKPWAMVGATGFTDRSMSMAQSARAVAADVSFDLNPSAGPTFSGWRNTDKLTLAVTTTGTMFASTRDTTAEGCNPVVAAELEVRFCN